MDPVSVVSCGMVTGVGLDTPASCAAIRAGLTGFIETRFMYDGEWLLGCPVPFEEGWRGREKLLQMLVPAIEECLEAVRHRPPKAIPLVLCLAERDRPGRFNDLDDSLIKDVETRLSYEFHPQSTWFAEGRIGGVKALAQASTFLANGAPACIVAGVDTWLVAETLNTYHDKRRIQTADNSDGFIPGEAGTAVLIGPHQGGKTGTLDCLGIGFGWEPATQNSEEPLRADGLAEAYRTAMSDAEVEWDAIDFRITDNSGSQYGFKETALALQRTMRVRKAEFDIWHPADCLGEIGAATVPAMLGVALNAGRKAYGPGAGMLCHITSEGSERAAMVLHANGEVANE